LAREIDFVAENLGPEKLITLQENVFERRMGVL
jgi:hypothetical protein